MKLVEPTFMLTFIYLYRQCGGFGKMSFDEMCLKSKGPSYYCEHSYIESETEQRTNKTSL